MHGVYDFRTSTSFALKKKPLRPTDLDDFVCCATPPVLWTSAEAERFRRFGVDALPKRDKLNFDTFLLKDDSLDDLDSLQPPDELAPKIVESLQAAAEAFQAVADELDPQSESQKQALSVPRS